MIKIGEKYQLKDGVSIVIKNIISDYESGRQVAVITKENEEYVFDLDNLRNQIKVEHNVEKKKTVEDKVNLYRSYFRGNDDIVATSFKTNEGKMVYYPWCHIRKKLPCPKVNKPNFQCSMCKVHSFQKMTDEVIYHHLRGYNNYRKEVMYGLYPIIENDKTYLLVFDFDKKNWRHETLVVAKIVEQLGIDYLIEISQSGKVHTYGYFLKIKF